jgi:hypothetical protein
LEQEQPVTTLAKRLAVVTVALLTAACSLTGTGDPATAATVGDRSIPAAEIDENLAAIRDSAAFQQQAQGDTSGQFVLDAQTQIVTTFIRSEILGIVAEQQDINVSDEEVAQARDELVGQLGGPEAFRDRLAEQGLSEDFVLQQLRDQRTQQLLQDRIGASEDLATFIRDEIADVPIDVNPRYGQWNSTSLAVAPYDPLAASDAQQAASEAP